MLVVIVIDFTLRCFIQRVYLMGPALGPRMPPLDINSVRK